MEKIGKKAKMEDHRPLVLKLENNRVIFQILLVPMEFSEIETLF